MTIEPTERTLDDPPLGHDHESFDIGPLDDRDLDPRPLGRFGHDVAGVCTIHQDIRESRGGRPPRREQLRDRISVLHVRGSHKDDDEQAQDVHEQMSLAALDLLSRVETLGASDLGGLDALAVDDAQRRLLVATRLDSCTSAQRVQRALERAVITPLVIVMFYDMPWRKVVWQEAPLAARPLLVQHGVHDLAPLILRLLGPRLGLRNKLFQLLPLRVRQVRRIRRSRHDPAACQKSRSWAKFLLNTLSELFLDVHVEESNPLRILAAAILLLGRN